MKTKFLALVSVIALVFSGCSADIEMKIQSNSKVEMTVVCDIEKDMYDAALLLSGMSAQDMMSDMGGADIKVVTIDGKQYYEIRETESGTPKQIMSSFDDGQSRCYISGDTFYMNINSGDDGVFGDMSGLGVGTSNALSPENMKMTFTVEFQKPITSTTGVKDAANANRVSFEVPVSTMGSSYTMFATCNEKVSLASVRNLVKKANQIARPKIRSVKAKKTKKKTYTATVKIKKVKEAKRYEIEYSANKSFKKATSILTKKTSAKIKKLKKNKTYYIRVMAFKKNYAGNEVASKYSKVKKIKVKG